MRAFDWRRLFAEHRIPLIERGPNVKRGEVNIRCPFCGSADPSYHMGISLETGWYSCWRNRSQHSGKSPVRLIIRLLGVPYARAREIAGLGDDYVDPEGFDAMAARLMGRLRSGAHAEVKQRRFLDLDPGFVPIEPRGRTRHHHEYLTGRGFRATDVDHLGRLYGVCAGIAGRWGGRVVLPYYLDGELVTWTARAIGDSTMRYRDLDRSEPDGGGDWSILPPKETLYNHDCIAGSGRALVIVEGPMDALKIDFYGRLHGVRAVGLSTNSVTDEQAWLLQGAIGAFETIAVMMDNAGTLGIVDSMRMKQELSFIPGLSVMKVPFGAKDGGELTPAEVDQWARTL